MYKYETLYTCKCVSYTFQTTLSGTWQSILFLWHMASLSITDRKTTEWKSGMWENHRGHRFLHFFSSPEPKAPRWAISIPVTPASVVRRPSVCPSVRPSVRQHFQTSSPLKPQGQLNSNFIWRLLRMGERKFVQMVSVTWPRWPPCPYMVKTL